MIALAFMYYMCCCHVSLSAPLKGFKGSKPLYLFSKVNFIHPVHPSDGEPPLPGFWQLSHKIWAGCTTVGMLQTSATSNTFCLMLPSPQRPPHSVRGLTSLAGKLKPTNALPVGDLGSLSSLFVQKTKKTSHSDLESKTCNLLL